MGGAGGGRDLKQWSVFPTNKTNWPRVLAKKEKRKKEINQDVTKKKGKNRTKKGQTKIPAKMEKGSAWHSGGGKKPKRRKKMEEQNVTGTQFPTTKYDFHWEFQLGRGRMQEPIVG